MKFRARIKFFDAKSGGRSTPISGIGYRPGLQFECASLRYGCQIDFGAEGAFPTGATYDVILQPIAPEVWHDVAHEGASFSVHEGPAVVGEGEITDIVLD